jgi:hypothetical protein
MQVLAGAIITFAGALLVVGSVIAETMARNADKNVGSTICSQFGGWLVVACGLALVAARVFKLQLPLPLPSSEPPPPTSTDIKPAP